MSDKTLSSKERALLEAARREVGAKAPPPGTPAPQVRPTPTQRAPRAAASPLDAPTVVGWDNPAAQSAPSEVAGDKWAKVAALMETERRETEERRQRVRRLAFTVLGVIGLVALIAFARAFVR